MAERIFLEWEEHALPAAARLLAEAHVSPEGPRLDRSLVVLAGARAGRRLRELLLEEAERRGTPVPPPRTVTVGALPELLYEPERPPAGDLLSRRVWADALRDVGGADLEAAFPEPPAGDALTEWSRLAGVVARLHADVAREGLDFRDVAETCAAGPELEGRGRWDALAGVAEAHRGRLRELGYGDRERARRRAIDEDRVRAPEAVEALWLVGVVEMPGVARAMVERLEVPVRVLVHAPETLAEGFDGLGLVRPAAWREREIELPGVAVCGRPPAQADAALAALSGEGARRAPDEVTVGVPDGEVVPHLSQRLGERGVPTRDAAGTPLEETRPYRLLEALADYLDGRRFADLAALLRHPDLTRRLDVPLEALDEYFEEHLPRLTDALPLSSSRRASELRELVASVRDALGLAELAGRRRLDRWTGPVLAALRGVYGGRQLDASRPPDRRLTEALERVADAAGRLGELPAEAAPAAGPAEAIRLLLSELRDEAIPPEPERPAVEMLGWLELHLDDAPALVLTGMDDASVPGAPGADPFLPDRLRARLGLPDDRSRHGRDAYLLEASLRPREEAHLVVGRESADGDPLRPSRLLMAASGEELARRVSRLFRERDRERIADDAPGGAGVPSGEEAPGRDDAEERPSPADRRRFRSPPEPEIRVEEVPDRLRVTDFRNLLEDPYRFALERVLGLEGRGDGDRELGPLGFGGLAHEVLHRFGESDVAGAADEGRIEDALLGLLEEERRRRYGEDTYPAVRLQVEQLRLRLRRFARWQARRVREGWRIAAVEVSPEGGEVAFEVDGEPVWLRGRIDRVDVHEGRGEWQLLDYKSGERPETPEESHRAGRRGDRRWVDLQLPLYRHLLPAIARREDVPSALADLEGPPDLGLLHLSGRGVELALADWSEEMLRDADEAARDAVRRMREGVFRHDPERRRTFRGDPLDPLFAAEDRADAVAGGGTGRDSDDGGEET